MFDAVKKISGMKTARLFGLFIFLTAVYLISAINVQAQYLLPYPFPSYPYFNPLISPFPAANFPIFAPTGFPSSTSLPPSSFPTAAIQGTTVYVPVAATSLNVSIGAPGLGLGPGTNLFGVTAPLAVFIYPSGYVSSAPLTPLAPTVISSTVYVPPSATSLNIGLGAPGLGLGPLPKLTGVAPPTTVLIYPVGFVPPAPAPVPVPVPVVPSPVVPLPVAPSPTTPVVIAPTVVNPTTIPPTTTALSAAVSGLGFLWFNPFFPIF